VATELTACVGVSSAVPSGRALQDVSRPSSHDLCVCVCVCVCVFVCGDACLQAHCTTSLFARYETSAAVAQRGNNSVYRSAGAVEATDGDAADSSEGVLYDRATAVTQGPVDDNEGNDTDNPNVYRMANERASGHAAQGTNGGFVPALSEHSSRASSGRSSGAPLAWAPPPESNPEQRTESLRSSGAPPPPWVAPPVEPSSDPAPPNHEPVQPPADPAPLVSTKSTSSAGDPPGEAPPAKADYGSDEDVDDDDNDEIRPAARYKHGAMLEPLVEEGETLMRLQSTIRRTGGAQQTPGEPSCMPCCVGDGWVGVQGGGGEGGGQCMVYLCVVVPPRSLMCVGMCLYVCGYSRSLTNGLRRCHLTLRLPASLQQQRRLKKAMKMLMLMLTRPRVALRHKHPPRLLNPSLKPSLCLCHCLKSCKKSPRVSPLSPSGCSPTHTTRG
jgi:hypothetical protein